MFQNIVERIVQHPLKRSKNGWKPHIMPNYSKANSQTSLMVLQRL